MTEADHTMEEVNDEFYTFESRDRSASSWFSLFFFFLPFFLLLLSLPDVSAGIDTPPLTEIEALRFLGYERRGSGYLYRFIASRLRPRTLLRSFVRIRTRL